MRGAQEYLLRLFIVAICTAFGGGCTALWLRKRRTPFRWALAVVMAVAWYLHASEYLSSWDEGMAPRE